MHCTRKDKSKLSVKLQVATSQIGPFSIKQCMSNFGGGKQMNQILVIFRSDLNFLNFLRPYPIPETGTSPHPKPGSQTRDSQVRANYA